MMKSNQWKEIYSKARNFYYQHLISSWVKDYNYFNSCTKILDVGCGLGRFLSFFPKKSVGLDISIDSLREARAQHLIVVRGSAINLPFKEEVFDGIRCSHIIEHFGPQEVYKLIKENARILKQGGILIIQAPLLGPQFYDEITHIRPYPPNAILSVYLRPSVIQQSLEKIPYQFRLLKLKWRYANLFFPVSIEPAYNPSKFKMALFLKIISLLLAKIGIHSWRKNGYTLVLKKTKGNK